jgi:hypothetical protein
MAEPVGIDDHSSDAHLTLEDLQSGENSRGLEEAGAPCGTGDEISIQDVKLTPRHASSRRNSIHAEHATDTASVHSLPVAHVADPHPAVQPRPSTARGADSVIPPRSPASLSRSQSPQDDRPVPQPQRRMRHRLGTEVGDSLTDLEFTNSTPAFVLF